MPLETAFFQFWTSKNAFFRSNMEPNLGSKTTENFTISHHEPRKPHGSPRNPQSLSWTPPGRSENLENEPPELENLHSSTWTSENTQNLKKTWFWPATQNWQNLRQNLTILGTFGPILGKCVFSYQKLYFGRRPRISKIYVKIWRFCALLGRSWENMLLVPKTGFWPATQN